MFGRVGSTLLAFGLTSSVYAYDSANDEWDLGSGAAFFTEAYSCVAEWNSVLYVGQSPSSALNAHSFNASGTGTDLGYQANCFARGGVNGGYLWRSIDNVPYYTDVANPGSGDWTTFDEMRVGISAYPILYMCGVGNDMFMSTAEGLYRATDGDITVPVTPWSSVDSRNGISMVNFQGQLYVAANGRVLRYTEDGTLQDIWIQRDDDLVAGRIGRVWSLCVVNNSVMALANSEAAGSAPTIWAFQNEAWHHMATLPYAATSSTAAGQNLYAMLHDTETNYLWVMLPSGITYRLYVSETAINPYNDSATIYQPYGWVEWDWFDSPIFDAQKDYHSVRVFGENFDSTCKALVYWKDDDSTAWETLGTIDVNNEELVWTIGGGTRPNTTRLKLGVLLQTLDVTQTPRVRAIRVKYHLMVKDWFRWNMRIDVSGESVALQMLPDGTRHTLTKAQIKDNLDDLCRQVPPFVYVDVDGQQWLVKVVDANFVYTLWEHREATNTTIWEGYYQITLESIQPENYSA